MSINYVTGFCRGYVITQSEYEELRDCFANCDYENYDDFCDDYIVNINSWGDGSEGYFVGKMRNFEQENLILNLNDITQMFEKIDMSDFISKVVNSHISVKNFFTNRKCDCYIINFIW